VDGAQAGKKNSHRRQGCRQRQPLYLTGQLKTLAMGGRGLGYLPSVSTVQANAMNVNKLHMLSRLGTVVGRASLTAPCALLSGHEHQGAIPTAT
jgi:hypothetical protein